MTQTLIAADPPVVPPGDGEPPGQPYVSPDDLASIRPLWNQAIQQHLMPIVGEMYRDTVGQIHAELVDVTGVELPSVSSLAAETYLAQAANTFEMVGDDLWDTARNELLAGFEAGESIDQLATRLRGSAGLTAKSAVLVARTQVIEASNAGSIATARVSGLEMQKEWIATPDERTRPAHKEADGQKVDLNGTFTVGGYQADAPGDPSLPPALRYRCRCTLGYLMPDATVTQAQRDAVPEAPLPNTSGAAPVETAPVAAPVEDRAARRAAARARQKVIDEAEPVAQFAAEIDNVAYARQGLPFDAEAAKIFAQRLTQAEAAGVAVDDLAAVRAAVEARDLLRIQAEVAQLAAARELAAIGRAGELLPFDPATMQALAEGVDIPGGELVTVVRQGHTVSVNGEVVQLDRALVERGAATPVAPTALTSQQVEAEAKRQTLSETNGAGAEVQSLNTGSVGDVRLISTPSGNVVVKRFGVRYQMTRAEIKQEVDAEVLGAQVVDAVGSRAAATVPYGRDGVLMDFVDGRNGQEFVYGSRQTREEMVRLLESDEGRLMGIADYLAANADRNDGNFVVDVAGHLVGIDHGAMFSRASGPGEVPGGVFDGFLRKPGTGFDLVALVDFSSSDLAIIRSRLERLRGEFVQRRRSAWFDRMMARLAVLEKRTDPAAKSILAP